MERRKLGSTGFEITAVGLGTWAIGGWLWGPQDDADSLAAIEAALDAGVNWLDTAPIYGSGLSEKMCGDALKKIPASRRPLVFTKYGLGDDSDFRNPTATRAQVLAECDASLKRLNIDCIDLYQLHWPVTQPVQEQASACAELLTSGKIRAIGVCNFNVDQLEAWKATGVPLHTLQTPLSIFRPATLSDAIPWSQSNGMGTLAYSPLFRGMLFGTWTKDKSFAPGDSRASHKDYSGPRFARHIQAIDELKALAENHGTTCPNLALGALLANPAVTGCIVGARNAQQGRMIATLGKPVSTEATAAVWNIVAAMNNDLATIA